MHKIKYSKSSAFYRKSKAKASFFSENEHHLKEQHRLNNIYKLEPIRQKCKLCDEQLPETVDFHSHGIDYLFCNKCNHLNGRYEDTLKFVNLMYVDGDGKDYSKGYVDEGYNQRVEDIYLPKADFLSSSLPKKNYEILDVGCGAGHFVLACSLRNLKATGIDVSKVMIDFGNQQIRNKTNDTLLRVVDENSIYEEVKSTNAEVISAIGVIEHVREPRKFFEAFKQSRARYLFYEVPMFSLSALLENVSPKVFPRLLSGGHTHLFTENSLQKMNELMNVKTVAQWRFGADAQDLLRHLLVNLELNGTSKKTVNILENTLGNGIDEIQSVIDKNHFCSETHAIVERC